MGKLWAAVFVISAAAGLGCAQTKLVQRGGCWVKQTETFPKTIHEEMGPCVRKEPRWSNDRVARLVQECLSEADYRWQTQALAAWSKGEPLPAQQSEQTVMEACMSRASTAVVMENEQLKHRVAELSEERDHLRKTAQEDREHLRETESRMTDALGEAAKKPAPNAFATANSNGTATTSSEQTAQPGTPTTTSINLETPPVPVVVPAETPKPPVKKSAPQSQAQPNCKGEKRGDGNAVSCVPPSPELAAKDQPGKVEVPAPTPR